MKTHFLKILSVMAMTLILCVTLFASASALLGDINSDNVINASDARLILRVSAKLETISEDVMKNVDINADGNITSADARIALRISAKLETIEDYIVEPEIINAEITYSVTDDGYFIGGESSATINIVPDADCETAQVKIVDAADEVAYSVTIDNLKKDKASSFEWNGKTDEEKYVNSGSYKVIVTINETESVFEGIEFTDKNYFSGGNGSEKNPFLVASIAEFENIVRFPNAHYKQISDFDYEYGAAKKMFTADSPFNGVYDGNNKTFSNILSNNELIMCVGENGELKNIKIDESSFSCSSALTYLNKGKITNCEVNANVTYTHNSYIYVGLICQSNSGLVLNCSTSGVASATVPSQSFKIVSRSGGIAGSNSGKIINCVADVKVSADAIYNGIVGWNGYGGGIVGINETSGFIQNSEAKGYVWGKTASGGIAGTNYGQITNCIYTGDSNIKLSGEGSGIVS